MIWVLLVLAGGEGVASVQPSLAACQASAVEVVADAPLFAPDGAAVVAWCVELPADDPQELQQGAAS